MDGNKTSLIDAWKPNNTSKQSANAFRAFQTHLSTLDGDEIIAMNKNKQWANYARGKGFTDSGLLYFLDEADKGRAKVNKMDAEIKKLDKSATGMGATFKNAAKNIGANLGIMLAITIAVKALAAAYDHLVVTMEEQQEIVDNLRNEVEGLQIEYDELFNKGNLTEQEERRLEILKRQLEVKKELLDIEQQELAEKDLRLDNQDILNESSGMTGGTGKYKLDLARQSKQLEQNRQRINSGDYSGWVLDDFIQNEQEIMQDLEDNRLAMMTELDSYTDRYNKIQENLDKGIWDSDPEKKKHWEQQLQATKNHMDELQSMIDDTDVVLGLTVDTEVAQKHIQDMVDGVSTDWLNTLSDEELTYLFRLEDIGKYSPEDLKDMISDLRKEAEKDIVVETKITTADVITELEGMSEGFEKVAEIYNDVKDAGDFDFSNLSLDSDFGAIFGETEGFEEFVDLIAKSPDDINACQSAFDDLVSSWFYAQYPLQNINDENKDAIVNWLKSKGVINAVEVADNALAQSKARAWLATKDLTEMTAEEIAKFAEENATIGVTKEMLYQLQIQMIQVNEQGLNFSQQISALQNLAINAGIAADALDAANQGLGGRKAARAAERSGMSTVDYIASQLNQKIANSTTKIDYTGSVGSGSSSSSGGSSSKKDPHIAEIDTYKNLTDAVDEYDRKLEKLERIYDHTDNIEERIALKNEEIKLYQQQKDAIDELNKARDAEITDKVNKLRGVGFNIDYDPTTEQLIIHNREHINDLSQNIIETYEDYIDIVDELNDANKESADQWDELTYSIMDAADEIAELRFEQYEKYIEDQEHLIDLMANRKDAEGKDLYLYDNQMNATLKTWLDLVKDGYDKNKDKIQELEKAWMDYYDARIEREKELLENQLDDNDDALDAIIKVIDDEIDGLDDQIDALQKINEERKESLELQKAQAELDKARNQKTRMVLRKGVGWVYEADEDAVRKAEEDLADKQYESKVDALEDEKAKLEELKEKWEEIPQIKEDEWNKQLMIDKLGADAEEDILDGRTDIFEKFKDDYIDIQEQIQDKTDELEEHTSEAYLSIVQGFEAIAKLAGLDDAFGNQKVPTQSTQSSWYVNKDGTAPSQAKIGDLVYTKGGTYKITAKDDNGKFTSEKINNNSANIADNMWGKKFKEEIVDSASDVSYVAKEIVDKSEDIIQQAKNTILSESGLARIISDNTNLTDDEISAIFENVDITEMLSDETDDNTYATDDNTRAILRFIEALQNLELEVPVEEMILENFDDSIMSESDQAYVKELQRAWNLAMQQGNYELAEQIHAMADEARLRYLDDDLTNDFNKIAEDFAKLADSEYKYSHSVQIGGSNGDPSATQKYLDNLEWLRGKSEGYASQDFMDRLDDVEDAVRNGNGLTQTVYTDQYGRVSSVIDYADKVEEKESGKNTSSSNKDSGSKPKLNDSDSDAIKAAQKAYNEAKAKGDTAGMQKAHADAEAIRNKNGYSGGTDGSQYIVNSNSKVANSNDRNSDAVSDNSDANYANADASDKNTDAINKNTEEHAKGYKVNVNVNVSGGSSSGSSSGGSKGGNPNKPSSDDGGYKMDNDVNSPTFGVKVKKKAIGGRNLVEDIYNVDEKGRELLIQPTQGRYVHLSAGSDVLPADITDVLWKFGQNPSGYIEGLNVDYGKAIKAAMVSSDVHNHYHIGNVEMHGVDDWMGFINELQYLPSDATQHSYIR